MILQPPDTVVYTPHVAVPTQKARGETQSHDCDCDWDGGLVAAGRSRMGFAHCSTDSVAGLHRAGKLRNQTRGGSK